MSFPIQNFRSSTPGLQPPSLLPGQLFVNTFDKVLYTGNGTNFKTTFEGTQTPGIPGEGWFATPLSLEGLSGDFIIDPAVYGDFPVDNQVLSWDAALDRVVWADNGTVTYFYEFTNAEMIAAPGVTASEKLLALTGGVATNGSEAVVSGNPGDLWQGSYFYNDGAWFFASNYAWPTAEQVVYTPSGDLISTDVQAAIDELEVEKVETPSNTPASGQVLGWNGTATEWVDNTAGSVVSVSGVAPIVIDNVDPLNPVVTVTYANTASSGVVTLNDTVTTADNTLAATAGAVKIAYDTATDAQTDATQALADALAAQNTANQAVSDAAAAQGTANTALANAATAQGTADTALANAATAQAAADTAQIDATQALTNAANAQNTANSALADAAAAQNTADQAIIDAAAAAADAATKLPLAGGTLTGTLVAQNIDIQASYSILFNGGIQGSINAISDSVTFVSNTSAASSTAVKTAYDLATTADATANAALAKANSDLVAPTTAPNEGDYIRYNGTENTWASIYAVTATVNTFYANENITDIQPLIDATSNFGQINVAAGEYNGPTLVINNKQTLSITGPDNPTDAVNALIGITGGRDVTISGATTQRIRLTNLAIYGALTIDGTLGSHFFSKTYFQDGVDIINGTSGFIVFENCTFGSNVNISADFTSTVTFVNCSFNNTWTIVNNALLTQVVYSNCGGFASFPVNAIPVGLNVLASGLSTVNASQFLQSGVDIGALAIGALPRATYQALGDLVVGAAGGVPTRFPVATTAGYLLSSNPLMPFGMEWVAPIPDGVLSVTGTAPITVDNTDPANPVIAISGATTTTSGAVQLNDTTSSTSVTEALTANQGKNLQDQIDALANISNLTLAGTIDAATAFINTVTAKGAAEGFVVGSVLPAPTAAILDYFVIVDVPGTMTPTGGTTPQDCDLGDWWYCDGTAWVFLNVGYKAPYASTTAPGVVQLATDAEVQAGSNTTNAVVPSSLQSKLSDSTSTTSSTTIASSTAVKSAYDLADAALPKAGGTMTGTITFAAGQTFPGVVTSVTGAGAISITGTATDPVVNVASASVTVAGVVQLNDAVNSTSVTEAATPNAVKTAYDLAAAALPASIYTTKGDLVAGGTAGAPTRLPVTANDGYVLSADSASSTGLSWNATLAANTIYANVGQVDIQTAIDEAVPGQQTQIIMSPGEFLAGTFPTNEVFASGVDELTILGSPAPKGSYTSTIGTVTPPTSYRDFTFDNGSVYFNMRDLAIKGNLTFTDTQLKAYFDNVTVVGRTSFTGTNTNFIFFFNCNFTDNISFTNTFTGQAYFVGCTFNNHTINTTAADPTQVICVDCDGFSTYPTNATLSGYNALDSGSTTVTANNFVTPTGTDIGALAVGALPKAGGTMTGNIVFNAGQTFPGTLSAADNSPATNNVLIFDGTSNHWTDTVDGGTY